MGAGWPHTQKSCTAVAQNPAAPAIPPTAPLMPPTSEQRPQHEGSERATILAIMRYLVVELSSCLPDVLMDFAARGGARMAREEILHIAEHGLLLTMPGALKPTYATTRIVQTTGGLDKGPLPRSRLHAIAPG